MGTIDCKPLQDIETTPLTVGVKFDLSCEGEWPEVFDTAKAEMRISPEDKFKIKLIEIQKQSTSKYLLKVVSYKTGLHDLKAVQIVDVDHSVVLSDLKFGVKSVMDPQKPIDKSFSLIGPMEVSVALYYWLACGFALLFLALVIFGILKKRWDRKKLILELQQFDSAQTPYQQFHATGRQLKRQHLFLSSESTEKVEEKEFVQLTNEIEKSLKLYVTRSYRVPALKWSENDIVSELRKEFKKRGSGQNDEEMLIELKKVLKEGTLMQKTNNYHGQDVRQLLKMAQSIVEKLFQAEQKKGLK